MNEGENVINYKIFIGLSGGLGPLSRTFPIAEECSKSGMEVCFSIYDESAVKIIESAGYKVLMDDDPTMPRKEFLLNPTSTFYNLDQYYAQMGLLDPKFTDSWIAHRINMLTRYKPDLVITDLSPNTMIAAKFLGIPTLSIVQSCLHPDGMPFHDEVPRNLPKVTTIINNILKKLDMNPINRIEELSIGTKTIVPSFPEIDPIFSKDIEYVGPISMNFIHYGNTVPDKERYVLVYPGRLQDTTGETGLKIVEQVTQVSKKLPELHFVIASTEKDHQMFTWELPKNVSLIPYFNEYLLRKASLFIHHGGHGSCLSSIVTSTPSLVLPTHSERFFNAKQIANYKFGDYIIPDTTTINQLSNMIEFMVNDPSYQNNIRVFQKEIKSRDYKGEIKVFDIVCSLLKSEQSKL
ncbi:hypothetical protein CHI07_15500 [Paenibacillus sp. 7884-2]|nr:hypothetical protein CHI07_15500 [Paenibacillus sp. 7884-2]